MGGKIDRHIQHIKIKTTLKLFILSENGDECHINQE